MTVQTPVQAQLTQSANRPKGSWKPRRRLLWLLLLLIPACLWLTSQVALWGLGANQVEDTVLSNMIADYGQWPSQQFSPLKPELIGTIRADQATLVSLPGINVLGTIVPFIPFGTGTQIAEVPSATPTATPTRRPTATPTPTRTPTPFFWPTRMPTLTETSTPWTGPTPGDPTAVPPTAVPPTTPPPLPTVRFSEATYTANEGAGNVTITVTLSAASSQTITVICATGDGTATAPADYTTATNLLTFTPGQSAQPCSFTIVDDLLDEDDETLQITLTNPVNATLGTPNPTTVTILDDDPPCGGQTGGGFSLASTAELQSVDNDILEVACGQGIVIDLAPTPVTANGDPDFDLVFYERRQPDTPDVYLDWVIVEVGTSSTGPWVTIFNWEDGGPDANTSLGQNGIAADEDDNYPVPMSPIDPLNPQLIAAPMFPFLVTGIGIDVDAFLPPGSYGWLRIFAPYFGDNDAAQVDYIDIR